MAHPHRPTPFLWFDDQAEAAALAYADAFASGQVEATTRYSEANAGIPGRQPGAVMAVDLTLAGYPMVALNGGPVFRLTPAISLFVSSPTADETSRLYHHFAAGGTPLMPLGDWPFNECYGWVQDRFGLSWQFFTEEGAQRIAPCLMFTQAQAGRCEEAIEAYISVFPESGIESIARYDAGAAPNAEGSVVHAVFSLGGQTFRAMDSALPHDFTFTEAVSLQVHCDTQDEIDHYWQALSAGGDPAARQCGWLKDRFGVSWQIVPRRLPQMLRDPDPVRVERVTEAFLQMKKFDLGALERAYEGRST